MFKVDQYHRVPTLSQLFGDSSHLAFYSCVEVAGNRPVWMIEAIQVTHQGEAFECHRRFHFAALEEAIEMAAAHEWQKLELYVLLPPHLSGLKEPTLGRCIEVWECQEPECEQTCWRLETTSGSFLHSLLGTPLGQEIKRRAWFRAVDFELETPKSANLDTHAFVA